MSIYRAKVVYSDSLTGEIKVRIPSALGVESVVDVSYIGREKPSNDYWVVPDIDDQIVVSTDDVNFNNVFWVQTDPGYMDYVGFEDSADSVFSFNNSTRTLSLSPVSSSYVVWVAGRKFTFTTAQSITIPNTTGGYFIAFDVEGQLHYSSTFQDLQTHAPVSFIYWDSTVGGASGPTFIADERHGIVMDWATHEYLHRTRGSAYASGFDASDYTTTGNGSSADHVKISISNGTFYDEDYQIDIVHSASPTPFTWQQRLQNGAYLPVYYLNTTSWKKTTATQRPLMYGSVRPYYNSISGASGSLVEMTNNRYGIMWVVASNGLNEPVFALMGQAEYSNIGDAQNVTWSQMSIPSLPVYEFRPLYKIIFQALNTGVYAAFREIMDVRRATDISAGTGVTSLGLDSLNDVVITTPTTNQSLTYNGTSWVNGLIVLGTNTSGNYVSSVNGSSGSVTISNLTAGTGLQLDSGTTYNGSAAKTLSLTVPVSIANGGTGATTAPDARTNLGLGSISTLNTVTLGTNTTGAYVSTVNGASGGITNVAVTTGKLSQFAATTSAELVGVLSDEVGPSGGVFFTGLNFTDYTPTLTAATTNPTNYTATGRYTQIGKLVYYYFNISFDTGASAGSGTYRISLPVNAAQPTPKLGQSGSVQLYDSSVAFGLFNIGVPIAADSTYLQMIYHGSSVAGVTNSAPWTWAASDIIRGFIIYEAA